MAKAPRKPEFSLACVTDDAPQTQQPFILLHGTEGFGKSSIAACTPDPLFLMVGQDKGFLDLLKMKRVKKIRYVPTPAQTWLDLTSLINNIVVQDDLKFSTLVIDGINLAQSLLVDYLVETKYGGSRDKATSFNKVYKDHVGGEFRKFIERVQRVQEVKDCMVFMTAHTSVIKFKNPEGEDFGMYGPDMCLEALVEILRPCSACLFGQHLTYTREDANKKVKGFGGTEKVIMTTRQATHIAKNRYGLPDEIKCPDPEGYLNPMQPTWDLLVSLIREGREKQEQLAEQDPLPESSTDVAA